MSTRLRSLARRLPLVLALSSLVGAGAGCGDDAPVVHRGLIFLVEHLCKRRGPSGLLFQVQMDMECSHNAPIDLCNRMDLL